MTKSLSFDEYADLGLGEGLQPGALPSKKQLFDLANSCTSCKEHTKHDTEAPTLSTVISTHQIIHQGIKTTSYNQSESIDYGDKSHKTTILLERLGKLNLKAGKDTNLENYDISIPVPLYGDIALGTSIRQQRELFEHEVRSQMLNHQQSTQISSTPTPLKILNGSQNGKVSLANIDKDLIEKKLKQTKQEVEVLKQDLELCQKQLDAKYKAIKIMQGEAYAIHKGEELEANKVKLLNRGLREEINKLQFEMDCKESFLTNSQDTWAERFDRVCQENIALMSALDEKTHEMKKMHAEKMAVCRERDELLALVDVQERQRFESLRDSSEEPSDIYNTFTIIELAVLGACQCRGPSLEPCGCALTAAKLKQEIGRLKVKISDQIKCLEEATITTDTYRIAFEEQLSRNRDLIKRFAEVTAAPQMSRADKAKAAIKWLIKQLNEEEYDRAHLTPRSLETISPQAEFRSDIEELFASIPEDSGEGIADAGGGGSNSNNNTDDSSTQAEDTPRFDKHNLEEKTDSELIDVLADMIADKSEALAHQKLTSKLLAKRNKELQQQLTSLTEGDDVFTNPSKEAGSAR